MRSFLTSAIDTCSRMKDLKRTLPRVSFYFGFASLFFPSPVTRLKAAEKWEEFAQAAASRVEEKPHVPGDSAGWFFPVRELKHLGHGKFWEKDWSEVASNQSDPVPSLVEFRDLLQEKGIELLLVPVPPKARIYPEKLDKRFAMGDPVAASAFWEKLRDNHGINVIDLSSSFSAARDEGQSRLYYCQQDSHYSPFAIERISEWIAEKAEKFRLPENEALKQGEEESLAITGDQVVGSEWKGKVGAETLKLRPVFQDGERGVKPDPNSPFLLLGDSHTLVFQQGRSTGMHTTGAGLLDHLSFRFGKPFDLVGVRGSGMVQARKQLFYRAVQHPGYWDSKKLVVWVFSEREFTQSIDRLISIPLER